MVNPQSLDARLCHHAEASPDRCAIAGDRGNVTYAELSARVEERAARLAELSVDGASVLGIVCAEDVEHLVLTLAAARLGATTLTCPTYEPTDARRRLLDRVVTTGVVGAGATLECRQHDPTADPNSDPALAAPGPKLLFSTSGTTGEPKIVAHADSALVLQARRHVDGPHERFACLASMEHNFVKRHRLYCVAQGATNVFLDPEPSTLVERCRTHDLGTLHLSAFQARELLAVPGVAALRGLRLKLGGSHVPAALRERLRADVTDVLQCGYGTTETGAIGFTDPNDADAGESVGRALPGLEIRIVDATGASRPANEIGEVAIRCDGMFLGYVAQPELTHQRLRDGWFHTGDVGRLDAEGRLHLGGRSDDMFVFNSMNIHPGEVEAEICRHPSVVDAVVVPHSSPVHGDVPVAFIVIEGDAATDLQDIKRFVRERVGLRTPRRFTVVEAIPRNRTGKVDRTASRALLGTQGTR